MKKNDIESNLYFSQIKGEWSDWNNVGNCSETCGGGEQEQERTCVNPVSPNGGADCIGERVRFISCNTDACPINYTYSWQTSTFGVCSETCGGGEQTRSVYCKRNDGQSVSDSYCPISSKPTTKQDCNTHACPINYTYSWQTSTFGDCSETCGGGEQTRSVYCKRNDGQSVSDSYCTISSKPTTKQECNTHACTIDGLKNINGVLYYKNNPFYGVGVNYFDLYYRTLINNNDKSYLSGLQKLSNAGIPFVRFNCGGFWPNDFNLYFSNEKKYFELLDEVVKVAESYNIGLIPSLFWNYATASDIKGESVNQLGNPNSKTSDFIREYTSKIVQRYKYSKAIWGWEMGNEYNLAADLPEEDVHKPLVYVGGGTPSFRTKDDYITENDMVNAFKVFANTVRTYDSERVLFTGNSATRREAWNLTNNGSWASDTETQFVQKLLIENPSPFDSITFHTYRYYTDLYSGPSSSLYEQIFKTQKYALQYKKPLFIGEFGANKKIGLKEQFERLDEFLYAIEQNSVQISAIWVYDFTPHESEGWNITFENDRKEMLNKISALNNKIKAKTSIPKLNMKVKPLSISNNYFQSISGWFVGGTSQNIDLQHLGPNSDQAVNGDYFGRAKITSNGTYWICSPNINVTGQKISLGGYLQTNLSNISINIHAYNNSQKIGDTISVPLKNPSDSNWKFNNIKDLGGWEIKDLPATTNKIFFCFVAGTSNSSASNPGYIDIDNVSGFELLPN